MRELQTCGVLAAAAICEEGRPWRCLFANVHLAIRCPRSLSIHPAQPSLEWMAPGTPEDSHLALAPLHFPSNTTPPVPPTHNKCYSSCIFNLLSDAIILYTPCSLILMELLLFIVGLFFTLLYYFIHPPPPSLSLSPSVCVHVCAHLCANAVVSPIRADWEKS